jgi:hypothetical protein
VRLVRDEREHDEVRVQAVHAVALPRRVARRALGQPDELHDLVLALARHIVACPHARMHAR